MTHIAIVTTSFPIDNSGAEAAGTFVADFAEELSSRSRVTVLAPGISNKIVDDKAYKIIYFSVPHLPLSLLTPLNPVNWFYIYQTIKSGQHAINSSHLQCPYDYIFAFWALPSGYWAWHMMKSHNIQYSIWALGSDIWSLGKVPIVKNMLKKVLQDSQVCFADGYKLKEDVETIAGRECKFMASTRQLNVLDKKDPRGHPPYRLTFIGRWHFNKGVDLLIDGLKRLDHSDWKKIEEVLICGGGPLEKNILKAVGKLQRQDRPVVCKGYQNKSQASDILMNTDYVLIPSRKESIPVIFSDAMQCGVPVVTTPVGDFPVLLSKYKAGILASEATSQSYYEAIRKSLHTSPEEFKIGIELAAKEFNLSRAVDYFMDCIDSKNCIH